MLSIKNLTESLERKYLTEKVNHENDEINALLRQYVGKKNIPSKAIKAIEDAGIKINGIGDRISFEGSNGKELRGWDRTTKTGPKKPMRHKDWQRHQRNQNWDLSVAQSRIDPIDSTSWDKVDLKGYLDSDRDNSGYDYADYNNPADYNLGAINWGDTAKALRPYSDEYKSLRDSEAHAKWDRDYYRRSYGILSDDEIEEKVKEFRDKLIVDNNRNKSKNSDAESKYDKAVTDIDNYLKDLGVRS